MTNQACAEYPDQQTSLVGCYTHFDVGGLPISAVVLVSIMTKHKQIRKMSTIV